MIHLAGLANSSEISSRNRAIFDHKRQVVVRGKLLLCSSHNSRLLRDTPRHRVVAVDCGPKGRNGSRELNHFKPFQSSFVMLSRLFTILSSSLGSSQASLEFRWMQRAVHAGKIPLTLEQMVSRRSLGEPLQYILGRLLFLSFVKSYPPSKVLNPLDRLIFSLVLQS